MNAWWLDAVSVVLFAVSTWRRSVLAFICAVAASGASLTLTAGYPAPSVMTPIVLREDADVLAWSTDNERWIWVWMAPEAGAMPRVITLPYSEERRRQYERAEAEATERGQRTRIRRPPVWLPDTDDLTLYPMPWPALPEKPAAGER
jgi:hypothetical protein